MAPSMRHIDAERLSAWISAELGERETMVVRAHVDGCGACARIAAELRAQVLATRGLERPEPPATLWSAIEGALERPSSRLGGWRATLAGALVGAAAVAAAVGLVVMVSGRRGGGDGVVEGGRAARATAESPRLPASEPVMAGSSRDPLLAEAEHELERAASSYEQAVERLRKLLEREQAFWDPEERVRVGERLARLDEAVAHSREVVRRDPSDSAGADLLFSAYQRQIQFLAEAVHRGSPASAERVR